MVAPHPTWVHCFYAPSLPCRHSNQFIVCTHQKISTNRRDFWMQSVNSLGPLSHDGLKCPPPTLLLGDRESQLWSGRTGENPLLMHYKILWWIQAMVLHQCMVFMNQWPLEFWPPQSKSDTVTTTHPFLSKDAAGLLIVCVCGEGGECTISVLSQMLLPLSLYWPTLWIGLLARAVWSPGPGQWIQMWDIWMPNSHISIAFPLL